MCVCGRVCGGVIESEKRTKAGALGVQIKRKKKSGMLCRGEKKQVGVFCVAYDNLPLFDGINKKKNLMQESSLGPATDYSSGLACAGYYIIHSL